MEVAAPVRDVLHNRLDLPLFVVDALDQLFRRAVRQINGAVRVAHTKTHRCGSPDAYRYTIGEKRTLSLLYR